MSKVQVVGPRRQLSEALQFLQAQGVLHLRSTVEPQAGGEPRLKVGRVPREEAEPGSERSLDETARRLQELLLILPAPGETGPEAQALPDLSSSEFAPRLAALEATVRALNSRRLELLEERDLVARYDRLLTALFPLLRGLERVGHVETVGILLRRDRKEALAQVERLVDGITGGAYTLLSREVGREEIGVLLMLPRELAPELSRLLFEQGIPEIRLPQRYAVKPLLGSLGLLLRRSREIPGELAALEAELLECARRWRAALRGACRTAQDRLARFEAMAECGETEHAFVISGWLPAEKSAALQSALEHAFEGKVVLFEFAVHEREYDSVPVALRNRGPIRPFELLLGLLPPPRYGSVDPTPLLAGSFPLFFGLMLGDVGYGLIALALALWARRKGWGGATGRGLAAIAVASSASAIVFGLLFGEVFGELGAAIGVHPLLLHRRQAVLAFLGLALALGGAHVLLGITLGLVTALRHSKRAHALAQAATLLVLAAGALALLAQLRYLPAPLGRASLVALAPLLAALVALEGVLAPLEVMKTVGNMLSYARLMALGLASVMLADVANQMAGIFSAVAVGVTAAVLLHAVNFVMGCFSPTIQALRLHYVEFFGKFYQEGGRPYVPFSLAS
jgi:V/A-type H+-transporting ATPase subunit I